MAAPPLTRRSIFAQAWPIMLGQASVPLVGIVDATVIGRTGDAAALAGVALGATVINLLFWSFGFLRMGTTGLVAQADGVGDEAEVRALLIRAVALGLGIGLILMVLQWPLSNAAFALLSGTEAVTHQAAAYVGARFLGAPAALAVFAMNGWLLGLGRTRAALALQILLNVVNIGLDLSFVWGLGLGAKGVGLGTAGAEWTAAIAGLLLCWRMAGISRAVTFARGRLGELFDPAAMKRIMAVNGDIMLRTIALLFLFAWFANAGARLGTATLAANHVLLQFISVAAFILDAFAFTAESRVGNAIGRGSREQLLRAVRLTAEFSLLGALVLAALFWLGGGAAIAFITTDPGGARCGRGVPALRHRGAADRHAELAAGRYLHRSDAWAGLAQCRVAVDGGLSRSRSGLAQSRQSGRMGGVPDELSAARRRARVLLAWPPALAGRRDAA